MKIHFLQKTGSKLVKFCLRGPICILHPAIGGRHPVPCLSTQITERQGTAMYYTQHSNSTSFFALLVKPTLNSVLNVWKHLSVVEQYPSVRACSAFWKIFLVFRTFSITLDSLDPRPILQLRNEKYCNNGEFPS